MERKEIKKPTKGVVDQNTCRVMTIRARRMGMGGSGGEGALAHIVKLVFAENSLLSEQENHAEYIRSMAACEEHIMCVWIGHARYVK